MSKGLSERIAAMNNAVRLDYRHHRWIIGVKDVAGLISSSVMNVLCNYKSEKNMRKKKITGTGGSHNISNGSSLPEDIIIDILLMLPVKSLLRFRCVCKSWNSLFKTPKFAKFQLDYPLKNRNDGILIESGKNIWYLNYDSLSSDSSTLYNKLVHIAYPLEYEKKEIVGSSNGLVCYASSKEDIIIIWNPFTKDYKKIPTPPRIRSDQVHRYGFGYDLKTEDYKLMMYGFGAYFRIHLYSLKLNRWKTITDIPFEIPCKKIVLFEGIFHWMEGGFPNPKRISFLDTADETVKHILLPKHFQHNFKELQACVLGGCLCVIGRDVEKNTSEVWAMKDYGVANSWTKIFTVIRGKLLSGLQHLDLKQYFKNDTILVHYDEYYNSAYSYDLNHEVSSKLVIGSIMPGFRTWPFFGSLVSPNRVLVLGDIKR